MSSTGFGGLNVEWALEQLATFINLTQLYRPPDPPGIVNFSSRMSTRGSGSDILQAAVAVEQILGRVIPGWRNEVPDENNTSINKWCQHTEAAQRAQALLMREEELRANLGDDAPRLSASHLHAWVWDGARSLWASGHFREAVVAAGQVVNQRTQIKASRPDLSETDLFKQTFSLDAPKSGAARLRLLPDDGGKTYQSLHRGVMAFAEGWFAAVRNPHAHTVGQLTDDEALEQLAALSMLARWVDEATVEVAK